MAYIGFAANYFQQGFGRRITTSDTAAGGDFFELNSKGNIQLTENPTKHPLFKKNTDGSISFYSVQDEGYYYNLITPLYRNKRNFMDWLEANLEPIPNSNWCVALINDAFDLDKAAGVQLDILGTIVGASRDVSFEPTDGSSSTLSDANFRVLIKATIGKNLWDGQIESLQPLWKSIMPGAAIMLVDNQDMTMNVSVFGTISNVFKDLIEHGYIVPKVQSVRINSILYAVSTETKSFHLPAFGFDMDNEYVSGFDVGTWVVDDTWLEPPAFGFDQDDVNISGFATGTWYVPTGSGSASTSPSFGWDETDETVSGFDQGVWVLTISSS